MKPWIENLQWVKSRMSKDLLILSCSHLSLSCHQIWGCGGIKIPVGSPLHPGSALRVGEADRAESSVYQTVCHCDRFLHLGIAIAFFGQTKSPLI